MLVGITKRKRRRHRRGQREGSRWSCKSQRHQMDTLSMDPSLCHSGATAIDGQQVHDCSHYNEDHRPSNCTASNGISQPFEATNEQSEHSELPLQATVRKQPKRTTKIRSRPEILSLGPDKGFKKERLNATTKWYCTLRLPFNSREASFHWNVTWCSRNTPTGTTRTMD